MMKAVRRYCSRAAKDHLPRCANLRRYAPVPTLVDDAHRSRDELINELRWLRMENNYLKSSMHGFRRSRPLRYEKSAESA